MAALLTEDPTAPAVVSAVEISTWPPDRLCRMALSRRLATRLSARLGSAGYRGRGERRAQADAVALGFFLTGQELPPG